MHALYNPHGHGSGEPGERFKPDTDTLQQLYATTRSSSVFPEARSSRPRYTPTTHASIAHCHARLSPCSLTRPPTQSPPVWAGTAMAPS
eukprot:2665279-Pleurochrysis_carterae.AAC.1